MTAPADASPDPLLHELGQELSELAESTLKDAVFDWPGKVPDPAAREDKQAEALRQVTARTSEVLQNTTEQITALRGARQRLVDHRNRADVPDQLDRVGHVMASLVIWFGAVLPLLYWQLGQVSLSETGLIGARAALVVAAVVCLRWSNRLVARAGTRLTGQPAAGGAGLSIIACLVMTCLVLLWRLWPTTPIGWVVTILVWAVGVVGAFFLSAVITGVATANDGKMLPAPVIHRVVWGGLAGLIAILVGHGVVGPLQHWVEYLILDAGPLLCSVLVAQLAISGSELNPSEVLDGGRKARERELANKVADARLAWRQQATTEIMDLATQSFNKVVETTYSTDLKAVETTSLGLMHDSARALTTLASGIRLRSLMAGLRGGAIGIAGPRGAGKSTLLTAFHEGKFGTESRSRIAVLENVPVRYDARDFVLHLFARTADTVIAFCNAEGPADLDAGRSAARRTLRRLWPIVAVVTGWLVVGLGGSLLTRGVRFDPSWFAAAWWPLVGALGAASVLYLVARRRPAAEPEHPGPPAKPPTRDLGELRVRARWELQRIQYQQKNVAGWSGKVSVPIGAEATVTGSREVTRQALSYPEIVHEFGQFLKDTIACVRSQPKVEPVPVVIILDELDKIVEPAAAQDFLNEIKALFSLDIAGFLFLISVSEDALAAFERRGLPVRDAFDSAFDTIFRLDYLTLDDSRQVVSRRVIGMPDPFVCLCHCLAGGLPRELIRVGRQIIAEPGSLADIACRVVAADLESKRAGLRTVAARGDHDEVAIADLVRHVDAHATAEADVLLDAIASPPVGDAEPLVRQLQFETLGYLYFLATVLEVFGPTFTHARWQQGQAAGDGSFDTLASVRQLFPVNARLAWLTTNAFRKAWDMPEIPPPHSGGTPR